ncbi:hypothetical protein OC861_003829 [Tilletia horrida]|nr:hypothetical protein OC861_003829 [Tilletia horrida]
MVNTRATSLAVGASQAAARSVSQAFPATGKAGLATHSAMAGNADAVATTRASKRARTTANTASSAASKKTKVEASESASASSAPAVVRRGRAASAKSSKANAGSSVKKEQASSGSTSDPPLVFLSEEEARLCTTVPRPALTFSVEEALDHLISADVRFERLRSKVGLRSFTSKSTKPLNLFQTLVTSILGQQISWMAARAILYKFTRIWWPELPEKPDWQTLARDQLPFPTPLQVHRTSDEAMRAAGLSFAKIKYVRGLAERFGTGQMDVRKLIAEQDEQELVRQLCEIKYVGDSLRRPDVLSRGDLGIQKGMVIWHLAGPEGPTVRTDTKRPDGRPGEPDPETESTQTESKVVNEALAEADSQVRIDAVVSGDEPIDIGIVSGASKVSEPASQPPAEPTSRDVPPLPADSGLTKKILQERRNGKKVKGMYLTPAEMNSLARAWHPYESIASLFMWALVD